MFSLSRNILKLIGYDMQNMWFSLKKASNSMGGILDEQMLNLLRDLIHA